MKSFFTRIFTAIMAFWTMVFGFLFHNGSDKPEPTPEPEPTSSVVQLTEREQEMADFEAAVAGSGVFENTWQTALPQTKIYNLIRGHFTSPLPAGKTKKKVLVLGYDGCRADLFASVATAQNSAVRTLLDNGGHAVLSYAGGVNYPAVNTQATSTAPGWCSMLTGQWADVHGIYNNGVAKSNDHLTLLTTLVQDGLADSTAYYVSWDGHFIGANTTYINEKTFVETQGMPVVFSDATDDNGTKANALADLNKADCSDFIFTIFEYTDHTGHGSGFTPKNAAYMQAFHDADATGKALLRAVESRESYAEEDWLILITTDHGGWSTRHGGDTLEERITFIISNQAIA